MSHPSIILMTGLDAGATLVIDEVLNNFAIGSDEGCNLGGGSTAIALI